jgi:glycosyltransferase involved in cell wall biosynthesis
MSTIQVYCDVSFAAYQYEQRSTTTGVGRVINHLVEHLCRNPRLKIDFVGGFEGDKNPWATEVITKRWARKRLGQQASSKSLFDSSIGFYRFIADRHFEISRRLGESREHPLTLKQRAATNGVRLIECAMRRDAKFNLNRVANGVFLSTYWPPPFHLPPQTPRVVILYDLFPLERPQDCSAELVSMMHQVISSLDGRRDWVVAISDFTRQQFCAATGFPLERVLVGHLAAEPLFSPVQSKQELAVVQHRYGINEGRYILMVANPQPRKNLEGGVIAFEKLTQAHEYADVSLVVVGNRKAGWGAESLDQIIENDPLLLRRIIRLESVQDRDMPAIYSGASALLFPSFFEGFGLPPLEAMRCGTPVVCSNTTSLPEVVGSAGMLIDPTSPEAMARALETLLSDSSVSAHYRKAGLIRAQLFHWESFANIVATAVINADFGKTSQ